MPDNRKPLKHGAFPVCRNYTVRAYVRKPCYNQRSRCCFCFGNVRTLRQSGNASNVHSCRRREHETRCINRLERNKRITQSRPGTLPSGVFMPNCGGVPSVPEMFQVFEQKWNRIFLYRTRFFCGFVPNVPNVPSFLYRGTIVQLKNGAFYPAYWFWYWF